LKVLVLPEELRSVLKEPLGRLCRGMGLECVQAMAPELEAATKIIAVGDVTAYYLLEAGILPDVVIIDHKTKRASTPEHVKQSNQRDGYKTIEVKNPAATLTREFIDLIKSTLQGEGKTRIIVDGEEDLATLPVIMYAPLGAAVVYGQPNEGSVVVMVTPEKKEEIKNLMNKMIVEE